MYERFTDRARKAMSRANHEAFKLNHEYVGTEHLLLGLLQQGADTLNCAAVALMRMGMSLPLLRDAVMAKLRPVPEKLTGLGKLPLTPRSRIVLDLAVATASELGKNQVGTEHLLLGMLREEGGIAADVLREVGVTFDKAMAVVKEITSKANEGVPAASPAPALTIDDILAFADRLHAHRRSLEGRQPQSPYFGMTAADGCEAVAVLRRYAAMLVLAERAEKHAMADKIIAEMSVDPAMAAYFASDTGVPASFKQGFMCSGVLISGKPSTKPACKADESSFVGYAADQLAAMARECDEAMKNPEVRAKISEWMKECERGGVPDPPRPTEIDYTLNTLRAARTAIQGLPAGHRARIEGVCGQMSCACFCGYHVNSSSLCDDIVLGVETARQLVADLPADIRRSLQPVCHASGGPCWCGLCGGPCGATETNQEKTL